jgi:hypothetical protein
VATEDSRLLRTPFGRKTRPQLDLILEEAQGEVEAADLAAKKAEEVTLRVRSPGAFEAQGVAIDRKNAARRALQEVEKKLALVYET